MIIFLAVILNRVSFYVTLNRTNQITIMKKKLQSLISRSFLALFVASIFLISSCEWYASDSDKDTTEDSQNVTETVGGDATQVQEARDESSDIETLEGKEGEDIVDAEIFTVVDQMPEYPGGSLR